ncbi:MAG: helix-turn-helix transcriptional regulator [Aerococcaceae bacterium]|nr:helix-turn-helix transcriptional regulator [Aerococcaceae bacterium]
MEQQNNHYENAHRMIMGRARTIIRPIVVSGKKLVKKQEDSLIKRLDRIRIRRNLSWCRISQLTGISQASLSKKVNHGEVMSFNDLCKIATVLSISLDVFNDYLLIEEERVDAFLRQPCNAYSLVEGEDND